MVEIHPNILWENKFKIIIVSHYLFGNKIVIVGDNDKYQKNIEKLLVYIALIGEFLSIF